MNAEYKAVHEAVMRGRSLPTSGQAAALATAAPLSGCLNSWKLPSAVSTQPNCGSQLMCRAGSRADTGTGAVTGSRAVAGVSVVITLSYQLAAAE